MRGVVFLGDRKVELRSFPDPAPGPGEVVIEIPAEGGTTKPVTTSGRWSAKGDERPENAQLAREHALKEASEFGLIGLLKASASKKHAAANL